MGLRPQGVFPRAMPPLDTDLEVAERDFIVGVQHLVRGGRGIGGVIVNDPEADGAGFDREAQLRLLRLARLAVPETFPLIAAVSAGDRAEVIARVEDTAGVADAVIVFPPHDEAGQGDPEGLFVDLERATETPLIVAQGFTGVGYPAAVLRSIAAADAVVGVVSAVCDPAAFKEEVDGLAGAVPVLCACEGPQLPELVAAGVTGVVSTAANVKPAAWGRWLLDLQEGRGEQAREWFRAEGSPLLSCVAAGECSNAAAIKHGLVLMGQSGSAAVRPPLVGLTDADAEAIGEALIAMSYVAAPA